MPDNLVTNVFRVFGNTAIVQEMTFKIWDGSRGLSFELPLTFIADDEFNGEGEEFSDILIPILKLTRLCAPSKQQKSKFLKPPGPRVALNSVGNKTTGAFSKAFNEVSSSSGLDAFGAAFGSLPNVLSEVKDDLR